MARPDVPRGTKAHPAFVPARPAVCDGASLGLGLVQRSPASDRAADRAAHGAAGRTAGRTCLAAWVLSTAAFAGLAVAAPLDALQESGPHAKPKSGFVEIALDRMNGKLDVLSLRPDWASGADGFGDLAGWRLRGGYGLTDRAWLEAALFGRSLRYGSLEPSLAGWQVSGQWRLQRGEPLLNSPDVSLRLSTWGNSAASVSRGSTTVGDVTVDGITVSNPRDRQWQLGPVVSWSLGDVVLSVFGSAGRGEVSVGKISARLGDTTLNWSGGQFDVDGQPLGDLGQDLARSLGLDKELATVNYDFRFASAGFGLRYPVGNWQFRGGYEYVTIRRNGVDSVIAARDTDNATYTANHTLIGEAAYRFSRTAYVFLRGQAMSNQFLAEIPFLYNGLTARRFDEKYGLLSAGVVFGF